MEYRINKRAQAPQTACAHIVCLHAMSASTVVEERAEAVALAEKYLDMKSAMVENAIPNVGLCFKSAEDTKPELDTPDSSSVKRENVRLSYLFQSTRLLPWRTIYDNICLVREDVPHEDIRRHIIHSMMKGAT